jgi:adenylyltransferase/sulfurtransferase
MSTSLYQPDFRFESKSVLVVGLGGLGCPTVLCLAAAGVGRIVVADDDAVELSNLHRQVLFSEQDVGTDKLTAAERRLSLRFPRTRFEWVRSRLLPENARGLVGAVDVVVEGADNFATKFLTADACTLEHRPVVQGAAIRWVGTAFAVPAGGRPCYRCLFEDLPSDGPAPNCDAAGVMGPVAGLCGSFCADLALRLLAADASVAGRLISYDGLSDRLREVSIPPRDGCSLCGLERSIGDIEESRYIAPSSAA